MKDDELFLVGMGLAVLLLVVVPYLQNRGMGMGR